MMSTTWESPSASKRSSCNLSIWGNGWNSQRGRISKVRVGRGFRSGQDTRHSARYNGGVRRLDPGAARFQADLVLASAERYATLTRLMAQQSLIHLGAAL